MSIGIIVPKLKDTDHVKENGPVDHYDSSRHQMHNQHPSPSRHMGGSTHDWSRTSFKVGRPKPSKIRYLSKKEILGIGLSILLSFTISIIAAYALSLIVPWVLDHYAEILNHLVSDISKEVNRQHNIADTVPTIQEQNEVYLIANMSNNVFQQHFTVKHPLIFNFASPQGVCSNSASEADFPSRTCTASTTISTSSGTNNAKDLQASFQKWITDTPSLTTDQISIPSLIPHTSSPLPTVLKQSPTYESTSFTEYFRTHSIADTTHFLAYYYALPVETILQSEIQAYFSTEQWSLESLLSSEGVSKEHQSYWIKKFGGKRKVVVANGQVKAFSGSGFHMHGNSLNYLVDGEKHWFVIVPTIHTITSSSLGHVHTTTSSHHPSTHHAPPASASSSSSSSTSSTSASTQTSHAFGEISVEFNPLQNIAQWIDSFPQYISFTENTNSSTTKADEIRIASKHPHVLHIVQRAGEWVFIPEGWYHGTLTTSISSVSIHYEGAGSEGNSLYSYYLQGNTRYTQGDYAGAIRMYKLGLGVSSSTSSPSTTTTTRTIPSPATPSDGEEKSKTITITATSVNTVYKQYFVQIALAETYIAQGSYTQAEELYHQLLSLNPSNPIIYSRLIHLFINHATRDVSESIAELLQKAEKYHAKEHVLMLLEADL
jgi:hypothetical protein